mgnify:FL=1
MTSTNTLLTIGMITNEALPVLENELTFTRRVNRQYDKQFGMTGAKIGDTLNIRKPVRYIGRRTPTLSVQGSTESSVPLTLSTQYGVDMSFTSADLKLSIDEFSSRFIQPAVAQMANMIDYDGLQQYINIYNTVGTPGAVPATSALVLSAGVKLDNEAAPMGERSLCLNPAAQAAIVNALVALFNPTKQISDQYLKGSMGTALGFDFYMDQNIAVHTIGTYAANIGAGAVTVTTVVSSGTAVVTGGWTSGDILNIGDVVTFGTTTTNGVFAVNPQNYQSTGQLRQFVVTSLCTANGGGAMTINISPAIVFNTTLTPTPFATVTSSSDTVAATAAVGVFGASATPTPQNLAFCKDAFTFATVMLPDMPGVENSRATSEKLGMSIRLISAYDVVNDRRISRLDLLGGWATLRPELACRIAG